MGASSGGQMIGKEIASRKLDYTLIGYLDSNPRLWGECFNNSVVLGSFDKFADLARSHDIDEVIVAISNIDSTILEELNAISKKNSIDFRVLPSVIDTNSPYSILAETRNINISDLLGRKEVSKISIDATTSARDKKIFVTGGAGSIGSEIIRQIAKLQPSSIVALDVNENNLYMLELSMSRKFPHISFTPVVCSIQDRSSIFKVINESKPDILFHCAAHKHVPLMEKSAHQAVKNNLLGTINVAEAAQAAQINRFVLISTDKAVNPKSIMGASKRLAEMAISSINSSPNQCTKYITVRFGNVLGSAGSVIPIFQQLISEEKNLTVTDPEITRYFMTIPEAARLVIESSMIGEGGELFVLDMGKPVKIIDLANRLIKLSSANVNIDISGLRSGEKMYEELFYNPSTVKPTKNEKILVTPNCSGIRTDLNSFKEEAAAVSNSHDAAVSFIKKYVSEFSE